MASVTPSDPFYLWLNGWFSDCKIAQLQSICGVGIGLFDNKAACG